MSSGRPWLIAIPGIWQGARSFPRKDLYLSAACFLEFSTFPLTIVERILTRASGLALAGPEMRQSSTDF
jgi:hypothetical protein